MGSFVLIEQIEHPVPRHKFTAARIEQDSTGTDPDWSSPKLLSGMDLDDKRNL